MNADELREKICSVLVSEHNRIAEEAAELVKKHALVIAKFVMQGATIPVIAWGVEIAESESTP